MTNYFRQGVRIEKRLHLDRVTMLDRSPGLSLPASDPLVARLCRYFVGGRVLHAISAALYQDGRLLIQTRPVHCYTLTEHGLKMQLQSMLDAFSQSSGVTLHSFQEINDLLLEAHSCPVRDCHLNPACRLEEFL